MSQATHLDLFNSSFAIDRTLHATFAKPSIVELDGKEYIADRIDIKGSTISLDCQEIDIVKIKKIIVKAEHVLSVFANNVKLQFQNVHDIRNTSGSGILSVLGNVLCHVDNYCGPVSCKSFTECRTASGHVIQTEISNLLAFDVMPYISFTGDVLTFTGECCITRVLGWVNNIYSHEWHLFLHGHVPFLDTKKGSVSVENFGSVYFELTDVLLNNYMPQGSRVQYPLSRGGVHVKNFYPPK